MVMRIGGLASGMDIDALVEKLMNAERAPLNKLTQKKATYEWQRDAYRGVNTKLKTFDTYLADNLVLKSMNSKTANVSNSNYLTATATGSATGTLSIEGVSQLATAARGVGNQVNAISSTKLSDLGITDSSIELKSIQSNGQLATTATKINFDPTTTTVSQFVSKINSSNAGVSAIFENGRLSITAKNTGDVKGGAEVVVLTGSQVFEKFGFSNSTNIASGGTNAVFQVNGIATERSTNSFSINGYNVTLKETFNQNATLTNNYNAARIEYLNASNQDALNILSDAKATANTAYNGAKGLYDTAYSSLFNSGVTLSENEQGIYDRISNKKLIGSINSSDLATIKSQTVSSPEELQTALNGFSPELKSKLENVTVEQFNALQELDNTRLTDVKNLAAAETRLENYNAIGYGFFNGLTSEQQTKLQSMASMSEEDYNNAITALKAEGSSESDKALGTKLSNLNNGQKQLLRETSSQLLEDYASLATLEVDYKAKEQLKNTADGNYQAAINRKNTAEVNLKDAYKAYLGDPTAEVSLTNPPVYAAPAGEISPITISSTTNVDDMMKKIKDFVSTYNALVKDFSDQTKQAKYRDYAPLTAEQRKEMGEDEIKLWEEKAKSGLLRNDSIIRNGLFNMRSLIYETNHGIEDSRYNTLFSIGITTSKNYNDGGTLEINEDKLRKAIEENSEAVEQLFKNTTGKKDDTVTLVENGQTVTKTVDTRGYLAKLRDSMKTFEINIEKKAGRSTMTDHQYSLGKSMLDVEKRISTWQDKLKNLEERYWKQFTAMESAINKANQQSSMFMQG